MNPQEQAGYDRGIQYIEDGGGVDFYHPPTCDFERGWNRAMRRHRVFDAVALVVVIGLGFATVIILRGWL